MSESLTLDWGDAEELGLASSPDDTVRAARSSCMPVPVRCLLSVDPYLSSPVYHAVLGMAERWNICEVVDGLDAVHLAESTAFDIVVLDLRLPVLDGYSAAARICAEGVRGAAWRVPAVILVVDSVHELPASPSISGAELRVLFRDSPPELIHSAMTWAAGTSDSRCPGPCATRHGRGPVLPAEGDEFAEQAVARPQDQSWAGLLSVRERQVLVSLCMGHSNRQLASALSVSEATVKTHVSHLLAKLGLASRVEAVVFAYENGVVVPGRRPRPG
jgi:DNA-binding NarL/FixJ family response regulator